jgi:uncharacterized protein YhjY with autotransporter beta-barrel domain
MSIAWSTVANGARIGAAPHKDPWLATAMAACISVASTTALAQEVPRETGDLTRNQSSVASAIDSILARESGTAALDDMLIAIESLPAAAIPSAYDSVAHEEVDAHRTTGVQSGAAQMRNIGDRVADLRAGVTGVSLERLIVVADGQRLDGDLFAHLLPAALRGGGASGDVGGRLAGLGVFVNGAVEFGDQDQTSRRDGLDYTSLELTLGADYRFTEQIVLGAAFGFSDTDGDFDRGGGIEVQSYTAQVFGLYHPVENFSIDAVAGYSWLDYDMRRRIDLGALMTTSARSDTDGTQLFASAGAMYDIAIEGATLSPFGRLEFQRLEIDGFRERGAAPLNLVVDDQNVSSLTSALGLQVAYPISTGFGILQPQARAAWRHEFRNNARTVDAFFVEDGAATRFDVRTPSPDRDWLDLGVGLSLTTIHDIAAFVEYEGDFFRDDLDRHRITAGLRYQF